MVSMLQEAKGHLSFQLAEFQRTAKVSELCHLLGDVGEEKRFTVMIHVYNSKEANVALDCKLWENTEENPKYHL